MKLNELTIKSATDGLRKAEFTSVELTRACLNQIKIYDKEIGAFLEVYADEALEQARESDKRIKAKKPLGDLDGIPGATKDNMLMRGKIVSAGSRILENYKSAYDATVVRKLHNQGAIILGRTNMDEFAMGSSTETSAYQKTKNPWNLETVPGGSSGGSAAAVAANMCLFALGSDTGGSIRQPASLCGVTGLKPTYGRVSRYGLIAMASSLDQIGPLTKTAEDAKIVLEAIEGKDARDATSVDLLSQIEPSTLNAKRFTLKDLRIGVPKEYFIAGMDGEVEKRVREAIKKFEDLGVKVEEISLPHSEYGLAIYYIIMPAEVSANLARFDGIRYGASAPGEKLWDVYDNTRGQNFGAEVRRRIMLGTYVLSAGYYDAYYKKAQQVRTLVKQDFDKALHQVDVILTPTSPGVAWKLGEKFNDPLTMYLSDIYTVSANVAGLPAVSVPCGFAHDLPVGLQIIGKQFDDEKVLQVAQAYQENTEWHTKKPSL